jgi:hypothetical protein
MQEKVLEVRVPLEEALAMTWNERIFPIVTRTPMGVYTIEGLSEDEFVYLVALLGTGNSLVGEDGALGTEPLTPGANGLYAKLRDEADRDGLSHAVDAVESAQEQWQRRVHRLHHRRRDDAPPRAA